MKKKSSWPLIVDVYAKLDSQFFFIVESGLIKKMCSILVKSNSALF